MDYCDRKSKNLVVQMFWIKKIGFKQLHNTLDSLFSRLNSEGIGQQTKKAKVFSTDEK